MPRKSDEPEYPMHSLLVALVSEWEADCPGILQAVHEEIATGNWDKQDGAFVPPYSLEDSFRVAHETLGKRLVALETARLHRQGPWLVRLGLSKPVQALTSKDQAIFDTQAGRAMQVLAQAQAAPAPVANGGWNLGGWGSTTPVKISFNTDDSCCAKRR